MMLGKLKIKIKPDSDKNLNNAINQIIDNLNEGKISELLNHKEMIGKLISGLKKV